MVTTRELESPLPVCCGTLYNLHIMLLLGLLCVFNFFFLGLEEAEINILVFTELRGTQS